MRKAENQTRRGERAFTLIELMVVIVILGGLIALVGPNVIKALKGATNDEAKFQINHFKNAIDHYFLEKRSLPTSLEDLTQEDRNGEKFMPSIPADPWSTPYEYRVQGRKSYTISSAGEDKTPGSDDDVIYDSATGKYNDEAK